jgi:hypothetical protein
MNLKDEVEKLLEKAKEEDGYQNPHFAWALIHALRDVYEYENAEIESWANDLWGM